jgi:hypothetical protein
VGQVAKRGNREVEAELIELTRHEEIAVRMAALASLARVSKRAQGEATKAVMARVTDPSAAVRMEAIKALQATFSKVFYIVTSYGKDTRALNFEIVLELDEASPRTNSGPRTLIW